MNASLKVDRMLITRGANVLYDESFHSGINIIHGSNGSGKSTLADFLFFGLGGDITDWRESAERAEEVYLQITTPGGILSLLREPSENSSRPMKVYFGPLGDGLLAEASEWSKLPYKRPEKGLNFSQLLFRYIGIPESISDGVSNITMHQILRILYVDQLTPVQRIFRNENFDTWQTRQAVGHLMAGIGGYDLFERQIELRTVRKQLDQAKRDYSNLSAMASA